MTKKVEDLLQEYKIGDVNLFFVRNRNEKRVVENMQKILPTYPDYKPNDLDLQDIYALALNSLPPRYVQKGSIVLREPVKPTIIEQAVHDAVNTVMNRPNYD